MSRNILELKSIGWISPERIQTLEEAKCVPELSGFDLKEEFFEIVFHPEEFIRDYSSYVYVSTYETSVCVRNIKGTTHPNYCGKSWLRMMMGLKRHTNDYDVDRVKEIIYDTSIGERIRLSKYGEFYFVDGGGNHRVCQAKFLGLEMIPCEVTEYALKPTNAVEAQDGCKENCERKQPDDISSQRGLSSNPLLSAIVFWLIIFVIVGILHLIR